jgi:hypothetical protein
MSDIDTNDVANDPNFMIEMGDFATTDDIDFIEAASVDLTLEQELSEDERTIHLHN